MKQRSGRVVGLFGLPCSGKTTVAKGLLGASREIIAHISTGDIVRGMATTDDVAHMAEGNMYPNEERIRAEIIKLVDKRRGQGAEVVVIDSCPRFDDQVKWMLEQQWVGTPNDGMLIQIRGDELVKRAQIRSRDNQDSIDALEKKIKKHQHMIDDMEKLIFKYGIPYYTVMNTDAIQATTHLAKLLGLRK